jgi:hypothetical protein
MNIAIRLPSAAALACCVAPATQASMVAQPSKTPCITLFIRSLPVIHAAFLFRYTLSAKVNREKAALTPASIEGSAI